jgi:hypothetical protein
VRQDRPTKNDGRGRHIANRRDTLNRDAGIVILRSMNRTTSTCVSSSQAHLETPEFEA